VSKHTATNLDTLPMMMQQRLMLDSKVPGCCCLSDTGNKILFRINISPPLTIAELRKLDLWLGLPGYRTSHQWTSYGATLIHSQLFLKWVLLPISLRQPQPYILKSHISLSCVSRSVAVCLDITLNLYEMQLFFRIPHWFYLISNLSQTNFDGL
jgi:hypothetical protein